MTFITRRPLDCKEKLARLKTFREETAMPRQSVACGQQLIEAGPLEVPTGFARNPSQFALADKPGLLGGQKQDVFLNGGCQQPENDDLTDAGGRNVCQARQFGVVFHLTGPHDAFELVRQREQARQSRRPCECFTCGAQPEGRKRASAPAWNLVFERQSTTIDGGVLRSAQRDGYRTARPVVKDSLDQRLHDSRNDFRIRRDQGLPLGV